MTGSRRCLGGGTTEAAALMEPLVSRPQRTSTSKLSIMLGAPKSGRPLSRAAAFRK